MIDFTTYQYIPSVPLNNSSTDRKAQACPLVHRWGGEKRIEYIGDHLIGNSRTVVRKLYRYERAIVLKKWFYPFFTERTVLMYLFHFSTNIL